MTGAEMVPFYDVPSGRVVMIPARELRPRAVQARVEGVEGVVWLLAEQLEAGPIEHPPFDAATRADLRAIHATFAEFDPMPYDAWEEGFRRDANPAGEIAVWRHAAAVYREFAGDEPSAERRRDVYQCISSCLVSSRESVWHLVDPAVLNAVELSQVVRRYFGPPA